MDYYTKRGVIVAVQGTGGGVVVVKFADGSAAYLEAGFGMRQLMQMAEDCGYGPIGMSVRYQKDDLGIIVSIEPDEGE